MEKRRLCILLNHTSYFILSGIKMKILVQHFLFIMKKKEKEEEKVEHLRRRKVKYGDPLNLKLWQNEWMDFL